MSNLTPNCRTSFCISQVQQTFKNQCFRVGYSVAKGDTNDWGHTNLPFPSRLSMISAVFILFCSLVKGLKDIKNRESQHYSSWRQLVDVEYGEIYQLCCSGWPKQLVLLHWLEYPSVIHRQLVVICWQYALLK